MQPQKNRPGMYNNGVNATNSYDTKTGNRLNDNAPIMYSNSAALGKMQTERTQLGELQNMPPEIPNYDPRTEQVIFDRTAQQFGGEIPIEGSQNYAQQHGEWSPAQSSMMREFFNRQQRQKAVQPLQKPNLTGVQP